VENQQISFTSSQISCAGLSRACARIGRKSLHGLVPGLDVRARQIGDFDGAKPGLNARLYDATGFGRTATSVIWKVT
jgi:hypothetical protein